MKILFLLNLIILTIIILMMVILNLVSKKTIKDREKNSPFECGFNPKNTKRMPFSLQFFLIAVIFLIFDVELTLLIPLIKTLNLTNLFNFMSLFMFFMLILVLGTAHEWKQGALNWLY